MKPTPTMAAKALKNSEQCHSSCTTRRYNCERNCRPTKVTFLAMWTCCEGPRLPTLLHQMKHQSHDLDLSSFQQTLQNSYSSASCLLKFSAGALRKIRAKPAEKIGAVCPRIWESLVTQFESLRHVRSDCPIMSSLKKHQDTARGISEIDRNPKPHLKGSVKFIPFELHMFNKNL